MLSDEEREALEILRSFEPDDLVECAIYLQALEKITNLIEKQSKEIEELNKSDASKEQSSMNYYNLYKELVDKIKAKIEEIDKVLNEDIYVIDGHYDDRYYRYLQDKKVLQSLLEKE